MKSPSISPCPSMQPAKGRRWMSPWSSGPSAGAACPLRTGPVRRSAQSPCSGLSVQTGPVPTPLGAGPQGPHYSAARGISCPRDPDPQLLIPYGTAGAMTAGRGPGLVSGVPPGVLTGRASVWIMSGLAGCPAYTIAGNNKQPLYVSTYAPIIRARVSLLIP